MLPPLRPTRPTASNRVRDLRFCARQLPIKGGCRALSYVRAGQIPSGLDLDRVAEGDGAVIYDARVDAEIGVAEGALER